MLSLIFALLVPFGAYASGSVIGNGGDPLFYFLEATRSSLIETAKQILDKEGSSFCEKPELTQSQSEQCRKFFFTIAEELLRLNQGPNKTVFVLREQTLLVEGPDKKPMPVAARTQLGNKGEIEFHRDSIHLMSPSQILFLMAHEFGHKALFDGRYVTDNEPAGVFASGRELIDTMAAAVVESAKRFNKVGSQYGLRDNFECRVLVGETKFGVRTSSPRSFMNQALMSYETSLSRLPTDSVVFVPETDETDLVFRAVINEPANCDEKWHEGRKTELSILRQFRTAERREDEVVVAKTLLGFNPICEKTRSAVELSYGRATFSCKYFGTQGTTSMNLLRVPFR